MTAPEWALGHIVAGKYTVSGELGRGVRVRTYTALTEPNREVVLRVVGAEDASALDPIAARFEQLAALPEAYVLPILEVSKDDSGARFVATDRSRNPSLATLVELCPLTLDEAAAFARKLGAALDAVHDKGLTQLHLRPTNVFVGAMPTGPVELADPGVPRLDESAADRARWTPPEGDRAEGKEGAAADVFSAALVVFFAMTGKTFWKGTNEEELAAEIAGPRAAASKRASEIGVTLPASLDAAFERALSTDPRARPASVAELARVLDSTRRSRASFADVTATGPSEAKAVEIVAPPSDLVAGLIQSELRNADTNQKPNEKVRANEEVLLVAAPPPQASPFAAPAAPAPPASNEPAVLVEQEAPAAKRRTGLVVGAVAAAVVLLVAAGAVALARKKTSVATNPPASATAPIQTTTAPTPLASASATASSTASAASTAASSAAAGPLDAQHSELLVVCEPKCDLVMIDRKRMTSYPDPVRLAPGQHGVGVSSPDHWGDWKLVETKGGERSTVTFKLRSKFEPLPNATHTAAPTPTPTPTPTPSASVKKPCGKFLKRCDDE